MIVVETMEWRPCSIGQKGGNLLEKKKEIGVGASEEKEITTKKKIYLLLFIDKNDRAILALVEHLL